MSCLTKEDFKLILINAAKRINEEYKKRRNEGMDRQRERVEKEREKEGSGTEE